jgi:Beta-propeller repeat/Prokaryotic membrane lipoprotein lipid attachment site
MKKVIGLFALGLVLVLSACSQNPVPTTALEQQGFATAQDDEGMGIATTTQGVVVAGQTYGSLDGTNLGGKDALIRRYNATTKVWGQQYGSRFSDLVADVAVDSAGNSYVVGTTNGAIGFQVGFYDMYLRKFDVSGAVQWTRQFGTKNGDVGIDVALDSAGNIYVLGYQQGSNFVLRKFSNSGSLLLTKIVSDTTKPSLGTRALAVDNLGNVIVLAEWDNSGMGRGYDVRLYKYTNAFVTVWEKSYSSTQNDFAYDITTDLSNNLHFLIKTDVAGNGAGAHYVKMNPAGTILLNISLEPTATTNVTTPTAITSDSTGNIYIAASTTSAYTGFINAGGSDIVMFKYNTAGTRLKVAQLGQGKNGTTGDDVPAGIAVSDAVYITGSTTGKLLGGTKTGTDTDAFIVKLDLTNLGVVSIDQ